MFQKNGVRFISLVFKIKQQEAIQLPQVFFNYNLGGGGGRGGGDNFTPYVEFPLMTQKL